jgi:dTDP-4-amino-4,6-dideoxygalactose transaminase
VGAISGEPLLTPAALLHALIVPARPDRPELRHFALARDALAAYLVGAGHTAKTLLVPSYVCIEAIAPMPAIGQRVVYYPVADDLTPDWAWLEANAATGECVLLLVHYFGFANDVESAQTVCQRRGWPLIEDCAHSFLTDHEGRRIGTFGDAGLYSYRKMLPIPGGAAVAIKQPGPEPSAVAGTFEAGAFRALARQMAKYALYRVRAPRMVLDRGASAGQAAIAEPTPDARVGMSAASRRLMNVFEGDLDAIVSARRANYARLAVAFAGMDGATLPYPVLAEGTCPWLFPVLVGDQDRVRAALRAWGIPAGTWPTLPPEVASRPEFTVAHRFASGLMTLPVHQGLGARDMDRMAEAYCTARGSEGA